MTESYNRRDWRVGAPGWLTETVERKVKENAPQWLKDVFGTEPPDEETATALQNKEAPDFEERLKGFLRDKEAGRFGYNAWYGRGTNASPTAPPKEPTEMTLDEVLDWQRAVRQQGATSTAFGGYQIIYKTLLDAKRKLNLTGQETFDQDLQDRIASDYLLRIKRQQQRQPTIDDFLGGGVTKEAFAHALATEWASMPVLRTTQRMTDSGAVTIQPGQSYYKGVGSNKALVRGQELEQYSGMFDLAQTNTEEEGNT